MSPDPPLWSVLTVVPGVSLGRLDADPSTGLPMLTLSNADDLELCLHLDVEQARALALALLEVTR